MIKKEQREKLIALAIEVRKNSYSPYSNYRVGAALLTGNGKIYVGSNFENSSFGAGTCAERVALGAALSAGERDFVAICVCGNKASITPCGICRQALCEFGEIEIICCDENGNTEEYKLSEILPKSFTHRHLISWKDKKCQERLIT